MSDAHVLSKAETAYHLKSGEALDDGIRRILTEQVMLAIAELSNTGESLDKAVHEARKCVKRSRSLLRLIRPGIGKEYRRLNELLQSVSASLTQLRDAQEVIETLEDIRERHATDRFDGSHDLLQRRKAQAIASAEESGEIRRAIEVLQEAEQDIGSLPLQKLDFSLLARSLNKAFRRGKKAFSKAYDDPKAENFHECRKRVKDLRYQLGVLSKLWPDVFDGFVAYAKQLEEYLGDDHNLAVLSDILDEERSGDRTMLRKPTRHRQSELRKRAEHSSKRLYSESTNAWSRRLHVSWKAWQAETSN